MQRYLHVVHQSSSQKSKPHPASSVCPVVNEGKARFLFLDLAKGFTVLFIPAIHVVMLYSNDKVHESIFIYPFRFIAEWPGAQLLMFAMGMGFSFSKKSTGAHLRRALLIFTAGYLLNVLKFVLPYHFHLLAKAFVKDLSFVHGRSTTLHLLLIGDILQFAGIALAVLALLKRLRYHVIIAVLVSFALIVGSFSLWDLHHSNFVIDYVFHLASGYPSDVFFPLFPWLIYPLIGFAMGWYFQLPFASLKAVAISGLFLLAAGFCLQFLPYHFPDTLFWRTYPDKTIMHLGFVLMWVSLWIWIAPYAETLETDYHIRLLKFCGRNITSIYLLQWIVIFWMLPLWGYHDLDIGESLIAMSFVYVVVFGVVLLLRKRKKPG